MTGQARRISVHVKGGDVPCSSPWKWGWWWGAAVFYEANDPLVTPGAPYAGSTKRFAKPAFAARHNQKGCLVFADGHVELHAASDLITVGGGIMVPQTSIVWTLNPDQAPN